MPLHNAEAADRSTRVAEQLRTAMKHQGLSGVELLNRLTGVPLPEGEGNRRKWLSTRLTGKTNLVKPVKVVYGPTDELRAIAAALGVDPDRLVRVVND